VGVGQKLLINEKKQDRKSHGIRELKAAEKIIKKTSKKDIVEIKKGCMFAPAKTGYMSGKRSSLTRL
jgi:hypothetical protein